MFDFIVENYDTLLLCLVGFLSALATFLRTRSLSKSVKNFCEVQNMLYKKTEDVKEVKQEFSETVPDYVLNVQTNELEELEVPKNVQTFIQSYIDCALERALERYMPSEKDDLDQVDPREEYERSVNDLGVLAEAMEQAEMYRERYGLSNFASLSDIYAKVDEEAQSLKKQIAEVNNKEVKKDETSQVPSVEAEKQA